MFHEVSGILLDATEFSVSIDGLVLLSSATLKLNQVARILKTFYRDTIIHFKIFITKEAPGLGPRPKVYAYNTPKFYLLITHFCIENGTTINEKHWIFNIF